MKTTPPGSRPSPARTTGFTSRATLNSNRTGRVFAEALAERARAGVRVRLLYDWIGSVSTMASRGF